MILTGVAAVAAPKKKTTPQEALDGVTAAFYAYQPEKAREWLTEYADAMKRARKKADTALVDSLSARIDRMGSMMERVEMIEVVDSVTVPRADFFQAYRLSAASGSLLSPATLPVAFDVADPTVAYMPENGVSIMWGGSEGLMESSRFTDGTWDSPTPLGDNLNQGGVANFPFLMADGITLYYATRGDDSLGGYDIYISRRGSDGFLAPQNVGMPYNSPFDDYLLAIDESTGIGWWATDRNQLGDNITIYLFVPSEMRVNCDVNAPDLPVRASLSDWRHTRTHSDYSFLRDRLSAVDEEIADQTPDFRLPLPDGRVLTRWSQFTNPDARLLMESYVDALDEDEALRLQLDELRAAYAADRSLGPKIITLERKLNSSSTILKNLANRVIKAELNL